MGKKHAFYEGYWVFKCLDKEGNLKWEERGFNGLADEGEKNMLQTVFQNTSSPTEFYVRLCNDSLEATDTLADVLNEPSGSGYAAQLVERSVVGFPSLALDGGDWKITSKDVSFTAVGGDIGPVNTLYLATTSDNTGLLYSFMSLSIARTIVSGDTGIASFYVKLK